MAPHGTRSLACRAVQREAQHEDHCERQDPPGGEVGAGERGGEAERDNDAGRNQWVVADDEVVDELPQGAKTTHLVVGTGAVGGTGRRAWRRRIAATSASEVASVKAIR